MTRTNCPFVVFSIVVQSAALPAPSTAVFMALTIWQVLPEKVELWAGVAAPGVEYVLRSTGKSKSLTLL